MTGLELLEARASRKMWHCYHDTFTFVLLHEGYGEFTYRRRTHAIGPGGMMCLEPGNVHLDRRIAESNDFSAFFVDPGVVAQMLGTTARRLPHFGAASVESPALARCARTLRVALLEFAEPDEIHDALGSLVRKVFALNAEPHAQKPGEGSTDSVVVTRALEILRDSSRAEHSLRELARAAGNVSREHLIRSFATEIGITPHQYLIQLRVRDVRRLLRRGVAPSIAAKRAGFSDQSHLHRHFRRILGVTPGDYQRAVGCFVEGE